MEIYHVLNRSIESRDLFLNSSDYVRFVHNLYEFNDVAPAMALARRESHDTNVGPPRSYIRKELVKIHGWVLMRNHYHLLLSECVEGGLIKFMMKINVGYAKYYNERYSRQGHLFQGKTKKIHIMNESHFLYILHYVHLNPLDYLENASDWRERDKKSIKNIKGALKYLSEYRWSSYLDYCGKKNFPSILTRDLFEDIFSDYEKVITEYLTYIELSETSNLPLE